MNERCDNCGHAPASHDHWGKGLCAARNYTCGCREYVKPSPWAPDATPEQIAAALRSLPGGAA